MSEPIRVLHVLQRMEAAGVQTLLMNMYREIDRDRVQFDFLVHYTAPQFFDEEIEKMGGKIYRFSVREDYNFIKYYRDLKKFFRSHPEYKIVHGHMHSLGAIYLHAAKACGIPVRIAHSHTNATQNDSKKYIKMIMNHLYAQDANKLFACSQLAGKYMFGNKEFVVINNAIITDNFIFSEDKRNKKRQELGIADKFVIGNVGRFEIQKNQKFTVDVFEEISKRNPKAMLLLIGTGSMVDEIKEIVNSKGLAEKVMFLGNRRDVAELYQTMDVFLMPSLFEGLGIVGVEAQAAGTPTVCTDTLPEEIDVSPLIYRVPLTKTSSYWADIVEEAARNQYSHNNMKERIVSADYDMASLARKMQEFYLSEY